VGDGVSVPLLASPRTEALVDRGDEAVEVTVRSYARKILLNDNTALIIGS
jgi:hypothetical protein